MSRRKKKSNEAVSKREATIARRKWKQQNEFLEHMHRNPNITWASRQIGVDRTTIYRWISEDKDFEKMLGQAMKEGVSVMNDMMESLLIKNAKDGKLGAIMFWLRNRHPAYIPIKLLEKLNESLRDNPNTDLTQEQTDELKRVLSLFKGREHAK